MTSLNKDSIATIKEAMSSQILGLDEYPFFYSVVQFGLYDNTGIKLPQTEIRKFYDKGEVERTCKLIRNKIREALSPLQQYYFVERHSPLLDDYGDIIREGRFHLNILISPISDEAVLEPNRKARRIMRLPDIEKFSLPIENNVYNDITDYKVACINACIRTCDWVNKYRYSIKTQPLYEAEDLYDTTQYCLKDFAEKKSDFTDIVVFPASDFYSET